VFRLDVAVVGFVVFTLLAPLGGGYLAAYLLDRADSHAMLALFGGGRDGPAIAAALGGSAALALTLRFTAGTLLDSFVGSWPENRTLLTSPQSQLMRLNSRLSGKRGLELQDDGPLSLGDAVGWVGAAAAALLFAGMSIAAWPAADPGALDQIGAGTAGATGWLSGAFPVVARVLVASVLGILAGAAWSTFAGPAAQMEELEDEVEHDLDERTIVDAPAPDAPPR
jgi:hypothetical protein